jgi:hypothetical protein
VTAHASDVALAGGRWWTFGYPLLEVVNGRFMPAAQDGNHGPTGAS